MLINNRNKFIIILLITLFFQGCFNDKEEKESDVINENPLISEAEVMKRADLYYYMKKNYLWNNTIPEELEIGHYKDLTEEFYDLLYSTKKGGYDKWSFIMDEAGFQRFSNNQFIGMGISFVWDENENLIVKKVYKNSPCDRKGLKRSDVIIEINGYKIENNKTYIEENQTEIFGENTVGNQFKLLAKDREGNIKVIEGEKELINDKAVENLKFFDINNKKTAYFIFGNFLKNSDTELREAFEIIKKEGAEELIVDLRYNGGGYLNIFAEFAGLILGKKYENKLLARLIFNNNTTEDYYSFNYENSLNIERVFFITTKGTASASEYLINGLKPFIDVKLIGSDTHGKPVGMNIAYFYEYYIAPINFKGVNFLNQFDGYEFKDENEKYIFDGITADCYVEDDFNHELGDENEACLKETINYIKNEKFSQKTLKRMDRKYIEFYTTGYRSWINGF